MGGKLNAEFQARGLVLLVRPPYRSAVLLAFI